MQMSINANNRYKKLHYCYPDGLARPTNTYNSDEHAP